VRYHSLAALEVPDSLRVTAWAGVGDERVVMGVEHRDLPLVGVQFHPESVLSHHGEQLIRNFLGNGFTRAPVKLSLPERNFAREAPTSLGPQ
jgi:anthranilate/para-aminobenzoate synthase component II